MAPKVTTWEVQHDLKNNDSPNTKEETVRYLVGYDTLEGFDVSLDLYNHEKCPDYFDKHPKNKDLFVVRREAAQVTDVPQAWYLTVTYSNTWQNNGQNFTPGSGANFTWIKDPLARPAVINWDTYRTKKVFENAYDAQDKLTVPVETSAGERIILEDEISYRLLHVTKCVSRVDKKFALETDFINRDAVTLQGGIKVEPQTLWMTNLKISPFTIENGKGHYIVSFDLYHNPDKWVRKIPNQGTMEAEIFVCTEYSRKPGVKAKVKKIIRRLVRIRLPNGEYPSVPVPLVSKKLLEAKIFTMIGKKTLNPVIGEAVRIPDACGNFHIPAPESDGIGGLPKDFWKHNQLEFRTKKLLTFANTVPIK